MIDHAVETLRNPALDSEAVRYIYNDTMLRAGSFANGIRAPDFHSDRRGYIGVVFGAFRIAIGRDPSASAAERTRALGSFTSASLMELLALLSAVLRMEFSRRYDRREDYGRRSGIVSNLFSIIHTGEHIRDFLLVSRLRAKEAAIRRDQRWRQAQAKFAADIQSEPPERVWSAALQAHISMTGGRNYRKVVASLLPEYRMPAGKKRNIQFVAPAILFDAEVFSDKPIVLQGALCTRAIVCSADGTLSPGPQWEAWIRFLIEMLANPPPRKTARTAVDRPRLRLVGR